MDAMEDRQSLDLGLARADELPDAAWTDDVGVQPEWVLSEHRSHRKQAHGTRHLVQSVREFDHGGHEVRITTTYKVEIDGEPIHLHMAVGEGGHLMCHSTPYEEYASAVDVVRTLIDRFPAAFETDHGGHG